VWRREREEMMLNNSSRKKILPVALIAHERMSHQYQPHQPQLPLTPRETEITQWISRGATSAAIAEILIISKRTVDKHVEHILDKLNVANRTAAIYLLQQRSMPTESEPRRK
jgi:DNA-binding NarL/FixJ family response regulator